MKVIARALLVLALSVGSPWVSFPLTIEPAPEVHQMDAIVASARLSTAEKVAALQKYFDKCDFWPSVLHRIQQVDWVACTGIGKGLFEAPDTCTANKYEVGRYVFEMHVIRDARSAECLGFAKQYRDFLLDRIRDGGEAEFCRERTQFTRTAVGEYVEIAGQYIGDIGKLFCDTHDSHVVDILIRCLSAPDCVYGIGERRGKPGETTGSNRERDWIPLALARLDAARATPILRSLATKQDGMAERALYLIEHPELMWK